jgi:hypothetical protein
MASRGLLEDQEDLLHVLVGEAITTAWLQEGEAAASALFTDPPSRAAEHGR